MKSKRHPGPRTAAKSRKSRRFIFIRFITPLTEIAGAVWNQVFDFWKTLPDVVKTVIVLSFLSVSAGLLVPILKSAPNSSEPQEPLPKCVETIPTDSQSDRPSRQLSRKPNVSHAARQPQPLNREPQTLANTLDEHRSEALASARQAVRLGNYGEAFRSFKTVIASMPASERSNLAGHFNDASKTYDRGEFREAAYKMIEKLDVNPLK